jgi:hypothetical protein
MAFEQFEIIEIYSTKGQFETVFNSLLQSDSYWDELESLAIFNGDTIRKIPNWTFDNCD